MGLIAAVIAVYLGAFGPLFRWKGAVLLAAAALAVGTLATVLAAQQAAADGLRFAITPFSMTLGLAMQGLFMLSFYGMAALARWSARGLIRGATADPLAVEQAVES